ncbi:MAG TPA: phosphoribosylanthranilate isomerase [Acidimicrobiia bacterium]
MTLFVKLCGIANQTDLEAAVEAGADAVGLVITQSPRQVTLSVARSLMSLLPTDVLGVAVFHDPTPQLLLQVQEEVAPDLFQAELRSLAGLPGDRILPVVVDSDSLEADVDRALETTTSGMVLVDSAAKGGSGMPANWDRLANLAVSESIVLAGGLDVRNVAAAVSRVAPFGVDVSSGIERRPGEKDPELMKAFVRAARGEAPRGAHVGLGSGRERR